MPVTVRSNGSQGVLVARTVASDATAEGYLRMDAKSEWIIVVLLVVTVGPMNGQAKAGEIPVFETGLTEPLVPVGEPFLGTADPIGAVPYTIDSPGEVVADERYAQPCNGPEAEPMNFEGGYDNGFFIGTADGDYRLKFRGLLQARHYSNFRDIDPAFGDDNESGFVLERSSLICTGNFLRPELSFLFLINGDRSTGTRFVEEARINYEFSERTVLQVGRFRNPAFLRELDVSYARQLSIERSYFNSVFTTGVLEGANLINQGDHFRLQGVFSDGQHSGSAARVKDFFLDETDFAFTAGLDWKLFGEWAQYGDLTSWSDEEAAFFIGLSVHTEHGERGDSSASDVDDFIAWTADLTYENAGFAAFLATVGRHGHDPIGGVVDQSGLVMLSSYQVIADKFEPFIRYEYIDFDGVTTVGSVGTSVGDDSVNLMTVGMNWYFARQACKFTIEAIHAFDSVPLAAGNTGILVDQPGRDGQTVLGSQFQVLF